MDTVASPRDRIAAAAANALRETGLRAFTVAHVAAAAGVSTALVHYHFSTKQALLAAAAARLAGARAAALTGALGAGTGLVALDRLWDALRRRAASGEEGVHAELRLAAGRDRTLGAELEGPRAAVRDAIADRLPALLRELGSGALAEHDDIAAAIVTHLDGAALALAAGRRADDVRAAYDAFWLMLIAAGQAGWKR